MHDAEPSCPRLHPCCNSHRLLLPPQNFMALIPLALLLGDVTEDLAVRFGDTVGGLLNATFGNVVEMILSIAALQQGLYTVVAASLLGSILSNLLLVLGELTDHIALLSGALSGETLCTCLVTHGHGKQGGAGSCPGLGGDHS